MKVREALEILKQLPLNKEVKLVFEKDTRHDDDDPCYGHQGRLGGGSDHPCGGSYETQSERFGQR